MKQIRHKLLTRGLSLLLAGALAGSCSVEEKAVTGVRFSIGGVSSQESETRSAAIDSLASQNDSIAPVILALGDGITLECELREEVESLLKATTTAFSNGHKFRIISTRGSTVEDKGEFAAGSGDIHLTGLTSGTYTFSTYSYNNTSSLPSPSSNLIDNISPNQDLLYWHSGNVNISSNSVAGCNIVFKHLFPQVQVVVNAKDKNSSNGLIISALSAKLTPGKYARMDVTDGSLSGGTSGDFQQSLTWNNMNTSSLTSDFRSVYTNTAGAVNLVFDMASVTVDGTAYTGKTVTFNSVTLTPGKRYTMTVNINKDDAGAISTLGCSSVTGVTATQGTVVSLTKSLPYSGKTGSDIILPNGQSLGTAYGLTVSANGAQTLSAASGNISIKISGTPTTYGTVNIPIAVGGTSCSVTVSVAQQPGAIGTLSCSSVTGVSATQGTAMSVTKSLPYSGKSGANISLTNQQQLGYSQGLYVRANGAQTLSTTSGNISIQISGTPTTYGTVNIPITVGGASCYVSVSVAQNAGTISSLSCSSVTGVTAVLNTSMAAVTKSLPYSGRSGASISLYNGQQLGSASGLTATVYGAQTLSATSGNVTIQISGKPTTSGTVDIPITVGGASCSINVSVAASKCGAYVASGVWKAFMCHNLGANESLDPFTPAAGLHGAKYRWGVKNVALTMADDQSIPGAISNWNSLPYQTSNADWNMHINNPCPAGWRVPTKWDWDGVLNSKLNPRTWLGDWGHVTGLYTQYTRGIQFGSSLMLPACGSRNSYDGYVKEVGEHCYYWSRDAGTKSGWSYAVRIGRFWSDNMYENARQEGFSVRCIEE